MSSLARIRPSLSPPSSCFRPRRGRRRDLGRGQGGQDRLGTPKDTSADRDAPREGTRWLIDETRAKIYWRRSEDGRNQARLLFSEPDDMRGAGLLVLEREGTNDMFMYLPEFKRVRRVTGHMMSGSMFGTDFTYEQIERLQGLAKDAEVKRLPDQTGDASPLYVIEARPLQKPGEESELEKVVSFVAKDSCVLMKVEFYESGEQPTHVLVTDPERITREASGFVPRRVVMKDIRKGSETELVVDAIEIDKPLAAKHFSQSALESEGH
jgi:hypothetical protein